MEILQRSIICPKQLSTLRLNNLIRMVFVKMKGKPKDMSGEKLVVHLAGGTSVN